jgi:hypothetical protein
MHFFPHKIKILRQRMRWEIWESKFVLSSERMWHFNKIHLNLVAFSITTFVVFFYIDSLDGVKLVSRLNYQRVQKGDLGSTTLSSYKVITFVLFIEYEWIFYPIVLFFFHACDFNFVHLKLIKVWLIFCFLLLFL